MKEPGGEPARTPRVLIIEDDLEGRRTLERLFGGTGFEVHSAPNGLEAFSLLERLRFDVVICDVRMPQLGGMGLFQQLEERYPTMASRMIFLTGGGEDPEVDPFLVTSGQPYVEQPFEIDRLLEMVGRIARRRDSSEMRPIDDL